MATFKSSHKVIAISVVLTLIVLGYFSTTLIPTSSTPKQQLLIQEKNVLRVEPETVTVRLVPIESQPAETESTVARLGRLEGARGRPEVEPTTTEVPVSTTLVESSTQSTTTVSTPTTNQPKTLETSTSNTDTEQPITLVIDKIPSDHSPTLDLTQDASPADSTPPSIEVSHDLNPVTSEVPVNSTQAPTSSL